MMKKLSAVERFVINSRAVVAPEATKSASQIDEYGQEEEETFQVVEIDSELPNDEEQLRINFAFRIIE